MATAAAPKNLFEIEVPRPLSMFREEIISEANQKLLRDAVDQRYLTPKKRVKYTKLLKICTIALSRLNYPALDKERETLKKQHYALLVKIHDLQQGEQSDETARLIAETQQHDARLRARYAAINRQLHSKREPTRARFAISSYKRAAAAVVASDVPIAEIALLKERVQLRLNQHAAAVKYEKDARRREIEMRKEALLFARIIKERWAALGFRHVTYNRRGKRIVKRVNFQRLEVTEDVIYFKVASTSLGMWGESHNLVPEGVSINRLLDKDVIDDLTVACQREVWTPHVVSDNSPYKGVKYTNGAWLCINRLDANDGLLSFIELDQVMATFPENRRARLPLPAGVKRGRVVNWVELRSQPHLLIAGQTGSGKSNVFNVFITTILSQYTPDDVRLILVDLKEGVGFKKYENLPHLAYSGVVTELSELQDVLEALEHERHVRTMKIRTLAESIDDYNAVVSEKIPRLVLICDEYQEVASAPKALRDSIHTLTHKLAAKGRSAGIHLILGTQSPFSDMIPGKIKSNITFVLSGRQRTLGASFSTFGSKIASELPKVPGRMLCDDGMDLAQVQMPYASPEAIGEAIKAARLKYKDIDIAPVLNIAPPVESGIIPTQDAPPVDEQPAPEPKFGRDEIINYALEHLEGGLNARRMYEDIGRYQGYTQRSMNDAVKAITDECERAGNILEHRGIVYRVVKVARLYKLELVELKVHESAAD